MKNATEIVLVVDESGSMAGIKNDTIKSINAFIEEQIGIPGECYLTLRTFKTGARKVVREGDIRYGSWLTSKDYNPGGGTPLLDAVGEAIEALGTKLRNRIESERPDKVIFVIITDGEENDSVNFKNADIKSMITRQQDVYKWAFLFLGAGLDAFAQGGNLGIKFSGIAQYNNTKDGYAKAFQMASKNISSTRGLNDMNQMAWTASEQAEIKETK